MNGGGREQSINGPQRCSFSLCLGGQPTPAIRNRRIHNQDSAREASLQLNFQPGFESCPPLALRKGRQTLSNLSQRQNAEIEQCFIGSVEPLYDARLGLRPPIEGKRTVAFCITSSTWNSGAVRASRGSVSDRTTSSNGKSW